MKKISPKQVSSILVPIPLDGKFRGLIEAASRLALRCKANLRLIHVIKPIDLPFSSSSSRNQSELMLSVQDECLRLAEAGMREALSFVPGDVYATTKVLVSSSVAEAILEEADGFQADLILCGIAGVSHRFVPQGMSTVLSLMAHSPVPVLALSDDTPFLQDRNSFRVLIADDLQETGRAAAQFALEWGKHLGRVEINHVHVNTIVKEDFIAALTASMAASYLPMNPAVDLGELYEQMRDQLEEKLESRLSSLSMIGEGSEASYKKTLLSGQVSDQIESAADSMDADLIVFGKHKTLHRSPMGIGKLSYRAMLQQRHAIMVVPD